MLFSYSINLKGSGMYKNTMILTKKETYINLKGSGMYKNTMILTKRET